MMIKILLTKQCLLFYLYVLASGINMYSPDMCLVLCLCLPMWLKHGFLTATLLTLAWSSTLMIEVSSTKTSEDAIQNFTELASKYGYNADEYRVTTEDGYVLTVFHIPGDTNRTVLLMHGIFDTADGFILRGNGSLAATLATAGYDVWISNMRGNRYSRSHLTKNPDKDKTFWDFSFHEVGHYDLPAVINFILKKNSIQQLQAIGHSLGTSCFYVMAATRPEYNKKIKCFISLAPIAYVHHIESPLSLLRDNGPTINAALKLLGVEEILRGSAGLREFLEIVCTTEKFIGYLICAEGVAFEIGGEDHEEFGPDMLPIAIEHYPAGSSRKTFYHLSQVGIRKKFAQFDYGLIGNMAKYGSVEPPVYNLSSVTMPVALFVGKNDKISVIADVAELKSQLPNVVDYREMAREEFNHFDFIWGEHMYLYLFPSVFEMLEKYN